MMISAQTTGVPALDWAIVRWVLVAIALTFISSGVVIIVGRYCLQQKSTENTIIRSWIGIGLISGLLLMCGMSFALGDSNLRSTLFGGLIANVGAATAFYFASKSSDQARHDILTASIGAVTIPTLTGKTVADASTIATQTGFTAELQPPTAAPTDNVTKQWPPAGVTGPRGTVIQLETSPPPKQE